MAQPNCIMLLRASVLNSISGLTVCCIQKGLGLSVNRGCIQIGQVYFLGGDLQMLCLFSLSVRKSEGEGMCVWGVCAC